jgi:hypothetical protein
LWSFEAFQNPQNNRPLDLTFRSFHSGTLSFRGKFMFFFFSNRLGCLGSLSLGRSHGRAAFRVRDASILNQDVFMHLVVPLRDNSGRPFAAEKYAEVRQILTERFGGLTAFPRSPAQGTTTGGGETVRDEIVVFEVMTETLDAGGGGITEFSWSVPAG